MSDVVQFRDGMNNPTIIRQFKNAGAKLGEITGEIVYDATFGAPVGAVLPEVADFIMLSMLNYRSQQSEGLISSDTFIQISNFISQKCPELFAEDGVMTKLGYKIDPEGRTIQYTHSSGNEIPRAAAAHELKKNFFPTLDFDKDNLFFTSGGTTGLAACFGALKGEFFIPQGYFALYNNHETAFNGKINSMPLGSSWTPSAEAIDSYLQDHCVKNNIKPEELPGNLLLCNPGNPLTTMPSDDEYKKICNLLSEKYKNLAIVVDDPYANFIYDINKFDLQKYEKGQMTDEDWKALMPDRKGFLGVIDQKLFERMIIVKTLGKDIEGTGARIGVCLCGDKKVAEGLAGTHFNIAHTPPEFMQPTIAVALSQIWKQEHKVKLAKTYLPRLAYLCKSFSQENLLVGGDNVVGGMFAVVDMSSMLGLKISPELNEFIRGVDPKFCGERVENGIQLASYLMYNHKVAVVPGQGFGLPAGMIRVSATQGNIEHTKIIAGRIVEANKEAKLTHVIASSHDLLEFVTDKVASHSQFPRQILRSVNDKKLESIKSELEILSAILKAEDKDHQKIAEQALKVNDMVQNADPLIFKMQTKAASNKIAKIISDHSGIKGMENSKSMAK